VRISPLEEEALALLARFRFLTVDQFCFLGAGSDRDKPGLRKRLTRLASIRPALLGKLDFGAMPGFGRLPIVYYLTEHGEEAIRLCRGHNLYVSRPKREPMFRQDYQHRIATIWLHAYLWRHLERCGRSNLIWKSYYEPRPGKEKRFYAASGVNVAGVDLVPDALARFRSPVGTDTLVALEMTETPRPDRILRKLETYAAALETHALEEANNYPHQARLAFVFNDRQGLQNALSRIEKASVDPQLVEGLFLAVLDDLRDDFAAPWINPGSDRPVPLFLNVVAEG
jgi:hypothetical protein